MNKKLFLPGLILILCISTACGNSEKKDPAHTAAVSETAEKTGSVKKADETVDFSIPEDGTYAVYVGMEGGSGRAYIQSPAQLTVSEGHMNVVFVWSSTHYDYMLVDGRRYDNENEGGNSTFTIPVEKLDSPFAVIGDTTAMSTPHEVEYTVTLSLSAPDSEEDAATPEKSTDVKPVLTDTEKAQILKELENAAPVSLKHAEQFSIRRTEGYSLLTIGEGENTQYFVIVHGNEDGSGTTEEMPDNGQEAGTGNIDISKAVFLYRPLNGTYLAASSAMDLADTLGCLDMIRLSGIRAEDWYIENASAAMNSGEILYAGKYSAPDYELLLSEGCSLAIENTMICHVPEVQEKLEELGIPVMIERSSYEKSPLGRLEWIKVYGELWGKEKEAEKFYDAQADSIEAICGQKNTGKKIAFFSINSSGAAVVRKPGDYIAKMIEMSGGVYALDDVLPEEDNALSTMNMQFETFFAAASEADILIYNSTIEGELGSIDDLVSKNSLFKDFKAVRSGNVYCCGKNFYQQTTGMADFMQDINAICTGKSDGLIYLEKLD